MSETRITFLAPKTVCLQEFEPSDAPLSEQEIDGHTICSLISAGTEIGNFYYNNQNFCRYPSSSGYAAVFEVEHIGKAVTTVKIGDRVMGWLPHASYQRTDCRHVIPVPETLDSRAAPFARIAAVSAASLSRFTYRPGTKPVLVMGLGNVGIMAMQLYTALGYEVYGMDIDAGRAAFVSERFGLRAYSSFGTEYENRFGLALECSGTQQGTLECCRLLDYEGEMSLVGVPWRQTADLQSYLILNKIFYKYLRCFSGWENDLPDRPTATQPDSKLGGIGLALRLLSEGKMKTDGLFSLEKPDNPQILYDSLAKQTASAPSIMIDWQTGQ